jgi:glycosyltransferase involved in cell wall biosynthesis
MIFAIITNVTHIEFENQFYGYGPYVREMNIWMKYADDIIIVAPLSNKSLTEIDLPYKHNKIDFRKVPHFSFTSFKNNLDSLFKLPGIFIRIFLAMKKADHIHLRCPGNMGLVGCFVQILFPKKTKTAKYAGNWDPQSQQPWTYKLQKYILKNTFLTRNMKVLVYGEWKNQSENIKPFFTATYSEAEKEIVKKTNFDSIIEFVFVGSLVFGKNPVYAVELIEQLIKKGFNINLNIYGDGVEKENLQYYIKDKKLGSNIVLQGNKNQEIIKRACQKSHFVLLPSKSEGWPKAIAEAMFWGCVPIATKVSCVPFMLDYGKRGILLEMDFDKDLSQIENMLVNENEFFIKSELSSQWSRKYSTEVFESEIKKLF